MTLPSLSFGGLATPFDVNGVIDQIMAAESLPLQSLQATRKSYQDKDAAWSGIVTKISALRSAYDSVDLAGFVNAASSDESAVTASVTGSASPGALSFTVGRLASAHQAVGAGTFSALTDLVGAGDFTVTVGATPYTFTADATTTLQDLVDGFNALGSGVTATAVETDTNQFQVLLASQTTGDASQFTVTNAITAVGAFTTLATGLDSQISIGTLTIERPSNSISDLMTGVTIELKATTTAPVTVTTTRDIDAGTASVETLVAKLNDVLDELTRLTAYNADSGTAGILAGDSTARSLMTSLRTAISGAVGAAPTTYVGAAIGISITRTGSFDFDKDKFGTALSTDFDGIKAFVEGVLLVDLDTELDKAEGIDGSISRARDRWKNQIDFVDDRIADMEDRLDAKEAALIRQFAALDVALQTLNSQAAWLNSQLTSMKANS